MRRVTPLVPGRQAQKKTSVSQTLLEGQTLREVLACFDIVLAPDEKIVLVPDFQIRLIQGDIRARQARNPEQDLKVNIDDPTVLDLRRYILLAEEEERTQEPERTVDIPESERTLETD